MLFKVHPVAVSLKSEKPQIIMPQLRPPSKRESMHKPELGKPQPLGTSRGKGVFKVSCGAYRLDEARTTSKLEGKSLL